MLLTGVSLDQVEHLINIILASFDVQFQRFELVVGKIVLLGCFVPLGFAFVIDSYLDAFLGRAFLE